MVPGPPPSFLTAQVVDALDQMRLVVGLGDHPARAVRVRQSVVEQQHFLAPGRARQLHVFLLCEHVLRLRPATAA